MKKVYVVQPSGKTWDIFVKQQVRVLRGLSVTFFLLAVCLATAGALAQQPGQERGQGGQGQGGNLESLDPGPRAGFGASGNSAFPTNPGNPIQGLSPQQTAFFQNGLSQFIEVEDVALTSPGNGGLGPTFNSNSCGSCHSQPAAGGTSPSMNAFPFVGQVVGQNPQFTVGQFMGGSNTIPFFVTADGPVREARFKSDGGVHDLFTITGRKDATGCTMGQPDFAAEAANGNLSFRIPTPVFGAGMIENIPDAAILANLAASASRQLGIAGVPNRSGNDGSITRFGWKAQNKSLVIFAGEAYNVEMGVTNELFPNERGYPSATIPPGCIFNPTPEDRTIFESSDPTQVSSDVNSFANFMRFLDQPIPACTGTGCSSQIQSGRAVFAAIGCANCHTPSMTTATSEMAPGLSQVQANLFSDLALHHMGSNLADGISQGNAGPDQFRTAPLWGVGQRVFFLHDGRASNLLQAIREHASSGSEANRVIQNYEQLSLQDKQSLILFLRSL
ncbi:MAG TPA: di-heme oxidoredictase family protein [Candidatus Acidoferrum sp.]|nr:di-heme oxidoredictase family protein [Candidatus Acidoferrum sp.]